MKILVLGAGGVGGYYGARLDAIGADVTFLVRQARAARLAEMGLQVISPFGDLHIVPKLITTEDATPIFDLVLLTCKAYDLPAAITAIQPALHKKTLILPLLNGVAHIATLARTFKSQEVLGGVAHISTTMTAEGAIAHLNQLHRFTTGAIHGAPPPALIQFSALASQAGFEFVLTDNIEQAMWDKFVFLTTLAGISCLFRASVGQIVSTCVGERFIKTLFNECLHVASAEGHPLAKAQEEALLQNLTDPQSSLMASMLRDVEKGYATEADHILGDMLTRATQHGLDTPCLQIAYSHLEAYALRHGKTR